MFSLSRQSDTVRQDPWVEKLFIQVIALLKIYWDG